MRTPTPATWRAESSVLARCRRTRSSADAAAVGRARTVGLSSGPPRPLSKGGGGGGGRRGHRTRSAGVSDRRARGGGGGRDREGGRTQCAELRPRQRRRQRRGRRQVC